MQRPKGWRDASRRVDTRPDCRASCHETLGPERPASRMAPCPARAAPTADHGRARGNRQMSSSIAGVHSSGCRTTRRQRSARLRICAWRHGNQRYARHARFMAIHSAALDAQPPAQTDPTPAGSIRQQVTWAVHRISARPRGTPATGSVLPLFGLEDTRNRPSTRRLRRSFDVPEEETGPRRQRPLRSSVQPAAMLRTHAEPSAIMARLPCPSLPSLHHQPSHRLGRKKRGCRPSRLLILPTGNDQVFTNPSSQLSKAW